MPFPCANAQLVALESTLNVVRSIRTYVVWTPLLVVGAVWAAPAQSQVTLMNLVERCNSGQDYGACRDLGQMRARGEGGEPRDLMRALQFLDEACRSGLDDACADYRELNDTGGLTARRAPQMIEDTPSSSSPVPVMPADMILVRAGTFVMGSPSTEAGRDSDESQYTVTLTRDFWISRTEVTQGEYVSLMGANPARFGACGSTCPVESVSWTDAVVYANSRSRSEGLPECYGISGTIIGGSVYACTGYRLPTEAEWEYAARAGSVATLTEGVDAVAWYGSNARSRTHRVCERDANAWGLCDMLGNVWEWCHDAYGPYPIGTLSEPVSETGAERVIRGGSWDNGPEYIRITNRNYHDPWRRSSFVGFRLVRTAP